MVEKKTSAIIIFDVNERCRENEVRHISSDILARQIAAFIEENKNSIVIRFSSEEVPEEIRNKTGGFLVLENLGDNVQTVHDAKSYCMFGSDMLRHYGEKKAITEEGKSYTVYKETAEEPKLRDKDAAFFPENVFIDGIPADNLKYVADYLAANGVQEVYLTGYQNNVMNVMKDWGIGLMLERGIQPYLVPSLVDVNLNKYRYPYLSYPNCKEWLIDKIKKERCIVWQGGMATAKHCRVKEHDVESKEEDSERLQKCFSGRLMENCVYARYIGDKSLGFLREICVRYQEDKIVDIMQVFDGTKGAVFISSNGSGEGFPKPEGDTSENYKSMAKFEPGEMITKIETKCVSDKDYLTGMKIHTTMGKEYASEGWEQAEGTVYIPFEDSKGSEMAFCLEYIAEKQGEVLLGVVKKNYNLFRIIDEKKKETTASVLCFTYLYQIMDKVNEALVPKEEKQEFKMVFFEGYFYLYQNGHFLRKSRYLVMSSPKEGKVYKLTAELLEQTATKGEFLPYIRRDMAEGEFCWYIQPNKEELDFVERIVVDFTKGGTAIMEDIEGSEVVEENPREVCCLKCQKDITELANRINQGQTSDDGGHYEQVHYQLEADIEWEGEWIPIGTEEHPFGEIFNGQGHIISGISNGTFEKNCQGLFGVVGQHARIENIAVRNGKIRGNDYVGGIAGKSFGVISNCFYEGEVTAIGKCVGGISGMQKGGGIACCICIVSVKGAQMAGGLCGAGYIENESAEIFSSYTLGKVVAGEYADRLLGFAEKNFAIRNCVPIGYRLEMEEGKSPDFFVQALGETEEWDFETYTVPTLKAFSKQFQIERLRAHLEELKVVGASCILLRVKGIDQKEYLK